MAFTLELVTRKFIHSIVGRIHITRSAAGKSVMELIEEVNSSITVKKIAGAGYLEQKETKLNKKAFFTWER